MTNDTLAKTILWGFGVYVLAYYLYPEAVLTTLLAIAWVVASIIGAVRLLDKHHEGQ